MTSRISRHCPRCSRPGAIIDIPSGRWGVCVTCEAKWLILEAQSAFRSQVTDEVKPAAYRLEPPGDGVASGAGRGQSNPVARP